MLIHLAPGKIRLEMPALWLWKWGGGIGLKRDRRRSM